MQANILVDAAGNARIADFGLATVARDSSSLMNTPDGHANTPRWTAPEILMGSGYHSKESDVFSFGMVVIEVRGDESTACQTISSVDEDFHRQGSVQRFYYSHGHVGHHFWKASGATHSPQFHGLLMDIDPTMLGGETAGPPTDGSCNKTAVSLSL